MSRHDSDRGPVWARFDWTPERYEDLIRRVVPDYGEQEPLIAGLLREAMPPEGAGPFRVLELGAGTGTLSRFLLETFPGAELTALDVSPVMLDACADLLAPFADRVHLRHVDFGTAELGAAELGTAELGFGYHAAVSRLAIHHLEDKDKRGLFGRLAKALLPGGVLAMSDLVTGSTEEETEIMLAEWRRYMLAQGEDPAEWERWLVGEDDLPSPAQTQVEWLLEAGFAGASVVWQRAQFAVIRAAKAA